MTTHDTASPPLANLLAQADLVWLVADCFRSPEAIHTAADAAAEALHQVIASAQLSDSAALIDALDHLINVSRDADAQTVSSEYFRLFDGATFCPLNETAYVRRDKGAILGDLCGFYSAFGWTPETNCPDKPDHLVTQMEFIALLFVMAAGQQSRKASSDEADILTVLATFVHDHPGDWVDAMCDRLRSATSHPWFLAVADAMSSLWQALVQTHDWRITPVTDNLHAEQEPENPYECDAVPAQEAVKLTVGQQQLS